MLKAERRVLHPAKLIVTFLVDLHECQVSFAHPAGPFVSRLISPVLLSCHVLTHRFLAHSGFKLVFMVFFCFIQSVNTRSDAVKTFRTLTLPSSNISDKTN